MTIKLEIDLDRATLFPWEIGYREIVDHGSEDALERCAMRTLPEAESDPLEEHLLICTACRERLEETEQYIAAIRAAAITLTADSSSERCRQ